MAEEADFQKACIEAARIYGWLVAHFRPARVRRGGREIYETPVAADGRGFPDLVLVNSGQQRVLFVEVKADKGKLRPDQEKWQEALTLAGAEYDIWRPRDWERILLILGGKQPAATN